MARILTRSNRPIVIQEAQSGMDMLLSEVSKYVSPEYQQQRKANERADARFQLQVNAAQENENRYQDSLAQQEIINDRNRRTEVQQTKIFNDNQKTNARNNATTYAKSQFEGLTFPDISSLSKDAFLTGLTEPSERLIAGKLFDNEQKKAIGKVKQFNSRYETFMAKNPDRKLAKVEAESIFYDDDRYKDFLTLEYLEKKPDLTVTELKSLDYFIRNKAGLEKNLLKYEEMQQSGTGDKNVLAENITNAQDAIYTNESRIEKLLKLNENEDIVFDAYAKKTSALSPYSDEYLGDVANLYTGGEPSYDILFREESDDEGMAEPALQLATENASDNNKVVYSDRLDETAPPADETRGFEDVKDREDGKSLNIPESILNNIFPVLEAKEKNDKPVDKINQENINKPVFTKKPPGTGDQRHVMKNRTMRLPKDGSRILKNKIKDIQKNLKYSEDMSSGNVEMKKNVKKKIPEKIKKLKSLFDSIYDNGAFYNPNNPQRDPDNKAFGVYEDFLSKEEIEYLKGL